MSFENFFGVKKSSAFHKFWISRNIVKEAIKVCVIDMKNHFGI